MRGVLTSGVGFIEGCPHIRGGLCEGFHCIISSIVVMMIDVEYSAIENNKADQLPVMVDNVPCIYISYS